MAEGFDRRSTDGRPRIRVYVTLFNGEDVCQRTTCADYQDPRTQETVHGCHQGVYKYKTYPKYKSMRFDAPVEEVPDTRERVEGPVPGVVAYVYSETNHWSTCPTRNPPKAQPDFPQLAAGAK